MNTEVSDLNKKISDKVKQIDEALNLSGENVRRMREEIALEKEKALNDIREAAEYKKKIYDLYPFLNPDNIKPSIIAVENGSVEGKSKPIEGKSEAIEKNTEIKPDIGSDLTSPPPETVVVPKMDDTTSTTKIDTFESKIAENIESTKTDVSKIIADEDESVTTDDNKKSIENIMTDKKRERNIIPFLILFPSVFVFISSLISSFMLKRYFSRPQLFVSVLSFQGKIDVKNCNNRLMIGGILGTIIFTTSILTMMIDTRTTYFRLIRLFLAILSVSFTLYYLYMTYNLLSKLNDLSIDDLISLKALLLVQVIFLILIIILQIVIFVLKI